MKRKIITLCDEDCHHIPTNNFRRHVYSKFTVDIQYNCDFLDSRHRVFLLRDVDAGYYCNLRKLYTVFLAYTEYYKKSIQKGIQIQGTTALFSV